MIEVKTPITLSSSALSKPASQPAPALRSAIDHGLAADTREAAAAQICTHLAQQLDALRVCVAFRKKPDLASELTIIGHSNSARVDLGEQQEQALLAAGFEAVDQQTAIWYGQTSGATPRLISLAHGQLVNAGCQLGMSVLLTNTLHFGQEQTPAACYGSLTVELPTNHPLAAQPLVLLEALQAIAQPLCRLLLLTSRAQRKRDRWLARFGKPARLKIATAATVILVLACAIIPISDPVSAPARLEGEVQRQVAAPVAGILKSVHVRPGDAVKAGQLIAQLQEQDFELESSRLQGEGAQHESAMRNAMAKGDRSGMVQAQAKMEEVAAQLALVKTQLSSIQLRAPIDGVVISGDLQPLIGNPIDRGQMLAQVAPAARFRVVIEIDERDLRRVSENQKGELALSALPFSALDLRVSRIGPAAVQIEQRRAIEVFAQLDAATSLSSDGQLRPGLRGVAHLEAGSRPLALIWGQRLQEYWRLFRWRWLPWLN
jgi:multidrug efflux pump subunit AcrA (membrane-fusion protein)